MKPDSSSVLNAGTLFVFHRHPTKPLMASPNARSVTKETMRQPSEHVDFPRRFSNPQASTRVLLLLQTDELPADTRLTCICVTIPPMHLRSDS